MRGRRRLHDGSGGIWDPQHSISTKDGINLAARANLEPPRGHKLRSVVIARDRIRHHHSTSSLLLIFHTSSMVHEVPAWDSDSDYVEDDELDELDQDSLMVIQDRVRPAQLREMTVGTICSASYCHNLQQPEKLTPRRPYSRWINRLKPGISER